MIYQKCLYGIPIIKIVNRINSITKLIININLISLLNTINNNKIK